MGRNHADCRHQSSCRFRENIAIASFAPTDQIAASENSLGEMAQGVIGRRKLYIVCPGQAMAVLIENPRIDDFVLAKPDDVHVSATSHRYSQCAARVQCNSDPLSQEAVEFLPHFTVSSCVIRAIPARTPSPKSSL